MQESRLEHNTDHELYGNRRVAKRNIDYGDNWGDDVVEEPRVRYKRKKMAQIE